jgi:flagellar hook-associated protein 1 FlgK
MGTISSAYSLITQALNADQSALSVVANNVANASTTGYTKETSTFTENDSIVIDGVTYGQGVSNSGSTSVRDLVLTKRLDQQQQLASASSARLTALDSVQSLFTVASSTDSTSTAGNIGTDLTSFFSSFSSLEATPTSNSLRQDVLSKASKLAGDISGAASSLNSQKASLDQSVSTVTSQINALTTSIAQLNQQIQTTSPNSDAGTLEDQRQTEITALSKLVGVNQVSTENNGVTITTTDGQALVLGNSSYQITNGTVDGVTHLFVGTADITSGLTTGGGELGGDLTARDQDIPSVQASLDQLAYSVSTQVNTLNNAGTDMDGDTSNAGNIFSATTEVSGSAASMSVVMTDPNHIAAAASGKGTGDDTNAIAMADLGSSKFVDGQTPINYYSNMVSTLGSTVSEVETENTAQNASVTQLQTQSDSLSSVSLDDEASAMQQLERSYQAASKVFSVLNTIMASALNLAEQTPVS